MEDVSKDAVTFFYIFHPLFLTPSTPSNDTKFLHFSLIFFLFHILHNNIVSVAVWLEEFGDLLLRGVKTWSVGRHQRMCLRKLWLCTASVDTALLHCARTPVLGFILTVLLFGMWEN